MGKKILTDDRAGVGDPIYPTPIHEKVARANLGTHPQAILRLNSGWVFAADTQPVTGYCLLLSDPVVVDLNCLPERDRAAYLLDMVRIGDGLLVVLNAARINYETWGNLDRALHTHVVPRSLDEPEDRRMLPVCRGYDLKTARKFEPTRDQEWLIKLREYLRPYARLNAPDGD